MLYNLQLISELYNNRFMPHYKKMKNDETLPVKALVELDRKQILINFVATLQFFQYTQLHATDNIWNRANFMVDVARDKKQTELLNSRCYK